MKLTDLSKGYASLNAGGWVGNIPFPLFDGVRFKVRRLWNADFTARYEQMSEEKTDLADDANEKRKIDACLVNDCLTGWDGLDEPYSPETAAKVLADPDAGAIFRRAIMWCESQLADQVKASLETDTKN